MKNIITILILFVAVGCGKSEIETVKTEPKPLSPEEKLVGSYENEIFGKTFKNVFLENGKCEFYLNGKDAKEGTWKIVEKEVHTDLNGYTQVYKIAPNGDLIEIADIIDGKRTDEPNEDQFTWKKVKE